PARALAAGKHLGRIELRTRTGRTRAVEFEFEVDTEQLANDDAPWALRRKISRAEIDLTENILSGLGWNPLFGMLLAVTNPGDLAALDATLQSLRDQVYSGWRALISSGEADKSERLSAWLASEFPDLL